MQNSISSRASKGQHDESTTVVAGRPVGSDLPYVKVPKMNVILPNGSRCEIRAAAAAAAAAEMTKIPSSHF